MSEHPQRALRALAILAALLTGMPCIAAAQFQVRPIVIDVVDYGNGSRGATFGYYSAEASAVSIPYGASNFFTPTPAFRGQPTSFEPGLHRNAVDITYAASSDACWTLAAQQVCASSVTPTLASTGVSLLHLQNETGQSVLQVSEGRLVATLSGGATIYTDAAATQGVTLAPGSGSWASVSDVQRKTNFEAVDGDVILDRLRDLPIYTWSYRTQHPSIRHIGPTAQDFAAAFGVGESDTTITAVDADGVALASIQALEQRVRRLEERVSALEQERSDATVHEQPPTDAGAVRARSTAPDTLLAVATTSGDARLVVTPASLTAVAPDGASFITRTHADLPTVGATLFAGSGSWSASSSVTAKQNLMPVDGDHILTGIRTLPMSRWSYRAQSAVRHIGPTAQEFRHSFGLGEDAISISGVDADGVALAGARQLEQLTARLQRRLDDLKSH